MLKIVMQKRIGIYWKFDFVFNHINTIQYNMIYRCHYIDVSIYQIITNSDHKMFN